MIDLYLVVQGSLWATVFMLVWFKSDAFIEYLSLFGAKKLFFVSAYQKARKENPLVIADYQTFLLLNHNCFLTKLVICPLCSIIWCSIGFSAYFGISYFPFFTVITYAMYGGINKIHEENI